MPEVKLASKEQLHKGMSSSKLLSNFYNCLWRCCVCANSRVFIDINVERFAEQLAGIVA